ncbi:zwei Ig domain protein zig-8-like [Anopheles stephensi]|uniref:zwei Ig domain protein zig-8-like n=1 Tax=Anopheles stephensi TaxID=30069 RepID=UPI0016587FDB|nr:zwei Ig domain protein zig-8-like [Anopheles stephensi]XP_035906747.1 zwei Ig domain protein zig-8-like [Anopheles stephensi]
MHIENVLRASCIIWVSVSSNIIMTATTEESDAPQPYFDFDVPRNLTVTVGQTGFLHCRVERLGDQDVAWIRQRDLHILTMGASTYTSDQRFQVIRPEGSVNWTLQIKYPQTRDSGVYECQINTEPKMSLSYVLNVIELHARIQGPSDIFVKSGSEITMVCVIQQGPHELGTVFWYKGSTLVEPLDQENDIHSGDRGRITIETDWTDALTSRLKIKRAVQSDTGNYTCVPTMARPASVCAHVISGEHPAAMQHNAARPIGQPALRHSMCILLLLLHLVATRLYLVVTGDRWPYRGQSTSHRQPVRARSARGTSSRPSPAAAAAHQQHGTIVFPTEPS